MIAPRSWLRRFVREHSASPVAQRLAGLCEAYLRVYWNEGNWDPALNGERLVMQRVTTFFRGEPSLVCLDVGANLGAYTKALLEIAPQAQVHAFELVPGLASAWPSELAGDRRVRLNSFGLSDEAREVDAYFFPESPTEGRIHSLKELPHDVIRSRVIRGDDYLDEQGIPYVHLLKIDTEGHERHVLEGLTKALTRGAIGVIQFEYGTTYLASRSLLRDVHTLLETHGFVLGRLFPDGVAFSDYRFRRDEHFRMGNYVAVRRNHEGLITSLGRGSLHREAHPSR